MQVVIIKDAQGREISRIKASGEEIQLNPKDRIVCLGDTGELTSIVREGDELRFFLNNVILIKVVNFFSVDNGGLEFNDQHLSVDDIAQRLNLHVIVTGLDGQTREIDAQHASRILVHDGDTFEFLNTQVQPRDLHRHGSDLRVVYHLEGDHLVHLDLIGFFDIKAGQKKPPVVVLADKEHHTTDLFVQPQQQNFQMSALPITIATAGVMYAFYFVIKNYDPEKSQVEVLLDGRILPDWLSLNHMGSGKFILSGIPPLDFEGTKKVEINISNKEEGVNIRTQESYQLVVSARPELTERAAVVGVLTAETRGAVATHSTEGFLAGSQSAAAASAAPLALIAALSSLTVFSSVKAVRLEGGEFSASDADQFLKEDLELGFIGLNLGEGGLSLNTSSGFGSYFGSEGIGRDERRFKVREERDRDDERDDDAIITEGEGEETLEDFLASYDASQADLASPFIVQGDTVEVTENGITQFGDVNASFKRPTGLLLNDINKQTPVFFIKDPLPGVPVDLPSGATVTFFRSGAILYDPRDAWEFLQEGESSLFDGQTFKAPDVITYTVSNIVNERFPVLTINVIGSNDDPLIDNQTFRINENAPVSTELLGSDGMLSAGVLASDIDFRDVPNLLLTPDTNARSAVFSFDAGIYTPGSVYDPMTMTSTNQISYKIRVADTAVLDYEELFLNGASNFDETITFNITIEDEFGGSQSAQLTVVVNNINEAPILDNTTLQLSESTLDPANNLLNAIVGQVTAYDDDLRIAGNDELIYAQDPNFALNPNLRIDTINNIGVIRVDTANAGQPGNPLDFESIYNPLTQTAEFNYYVLVSDNADGDFLTPSLSDTAVVTIQIQNANERPVINDQGGFSVVENTTVGNLGSIFATDPDLAFLDQMENLTFQFVSNQNDFQLINADPTTPGSDSAQLVVDANATIDFEDQSSYVLRVRVTDKGPDSDPGNLSDTADITITVLNVNEAPIITSANNFSVSENAPITTSAVFTIMAMDPDLGFVVGENLTFSEVAPLMGTQQSLFNVASNGEISVIANLDHEVTDSVLIRVRVQDAGIDGPPLAFEQDITININNVGPVIANGQVFSVDENSTSADPSFGTISLSNQDTDAGTTYAFTDPGGVPQFVISSDGEITVQAGATLDFENTEQYQFDVTVTDSNGDSDTQEITINVNNLNDNAPLLDLNSSTVSSNPASRGHSDVFDISRNNSANNEADYTISVSRFTNGGSSRSDIIDLDGDLSSMTVQITNLQDTRMEMGQLVSEEYLLFDDNPGNGVTYSYVVDLSDPMNMTATLTYSGIADAEYYEFLLESVQYDNNASNPDTTARVIDVTVDDGVATDTESTIISFQAMHGTEQAIEPNLGTNNITLSDANNMLDAAQSYWENIGYDNWGNITINIADLSSNVLGYVFEDTIVLDINGAGHGWYVDETPYDHDEYQLAHNDNVYQNDSGQYDLLTVLMHELGHTLGFEDTAVDGSVMVAELELGTRILPDADILNGDDGSMNFDQLQVSEQSLQSLDDLDGDELISDDDLSFGDTQTSYIDDLMAAANTVQDQFHASSLNDANISLMVDDQQQNIV